MTVMDHVVEGALAAAEAEFAVLRSAGYAHLSNRERLEVLERLGRLGATIPGLGHEVVSDLDQQEAVAEVPCGALHQLVADKLRVRLGTGRRMLAESLVLGARTSLGGQVLAPVHPVVAAAERDGLINAEHVKVILRFFTELPSAVSQVDRVNAEAQLVEMAKTMRPEMVEAGARRILAHLNPDGSLDDDRDRSAKTGFWMGQQDSDGLTRGKFCLDAVTRTLLEAFFAKFAKPGMLNPADERPVVEPEPEPEPISEPAPASPRRRRPARRKCPLCGGKTDESGAAVPDARNDDNQRDSGGSVSGTSQPHGRCGGHRHSGGRSTPPADPTPPDDEPLAEPSGAAQDPELDLGLPASANGQEPPALAAAAARDLRNYGQRNLHALQYGLNRLLGDPGLGQHRGLPVTAVITMTIKDLEAATGKAISGGGAVIPIRDAIRMAAMAHQYLLVFDEDGRPLYLGRGKRLATADQRLVLYAGDRGCTFPDCPRPGYHSQAHHIEEWAAKNGRTDADLLTLACECHHPLVGPGPNQWATTKAPSGSRFAGRTIWHPPESIDPFRLGLVNRFHHPDEYLRDLPLFPRPDGRPPPQRE